MKNKIKKPIKGKKFKSFDSEKTGIWVSGTIWEDGTVYVENEGSETNEGESQ